MVRKNPIVKLEKWIMTLSRVGFPPRAELHLDSELDEMQNLRLTT
jgi:hypothetical protein